ncbi:NUDIX domain-containing protein [Nocardioides sp.]|uniref:NUDIX hydrolase n=1 Tax=Nocardioides sp. TaxID=35761 RepID=UPI001A1B45A0|nr:NUDIX domain-containing protein [Nocardioides sp.]MBJ7359376.1 NUDIX domain-containing protein [Nocardioides sp.]
MSEPPVVRLTVADGVARISWSTDQTIDDVHREVQAALEGHARVEAWIDPEDTESQRSATWAGMRREGVMRGVTVDGDTVDRIVYARLATDAPAHEPEGFRSLLNSFLPRKRAISQMLVRDTKNRVLLCQLTYKRDWDLPGGVVEVGESPQLAVSREVEEELGLVIPAGPLLLTDWLPPWSGWDDALCLVFDGGVHDPTIADTIVKQEREIKDAAFCTLDEVTERCSEITAHRITSALANTHGTAPSYTEGGQG